MRSNDEHVEITDETSPEDEYSSNLLDFASRGELRWLSFSRSIGTACDARRSARADRSSHRDCHSRLHPEDD